MLQNPNLNVLEDNKWLVHHGIKGQHWGIRNGPPYPIEDKVLKKGTSLNSVSRIKKSKDYLKRDEVKDIKKLMASERAWTAIALLGGGINTGYFKRMKMLKEALIESNEMDKEARNRIYTYNPDDPHDTAIYKGPFSYLNKMYRGAKKVYEHRFETVKDLKMPNSTERFEAFKDVMNLENKDSYADELQKIYDMCIAQNIEVVKKIAWSREGNTQLDFKNLKTATDYKDAYTVFNVAIENASSYKVCKQYMNQMAKKYDAMVDDNNVNVYNDAHDPIIVFNAATNLIAKTKPMEVKMSEIKDNLDKVDQYMMKKYGTVSLL